MGRGVGDVARAATVEQGERGPKIAIGQGRERSVTGDTWVVPRGGEYFFSPSVTPLKERKEFGGTVPQGEESGRREEL